MESLVARILQVSLQPVTQVSREIEEPPIKWFLNLKHLNRVDKLLPEEQSLICARPSTVSPEECELEKYCETNHKKDNLEVHPFNY